MTCQDIRLEWKQRNCSAWISRSPLHASMPQSLLNPHLWPQQLVWRVNPPQQSLLAVLIYMTVWLLLSFSTASGSAKGLGFLCGVLSRFCLEDDLGNWLPPPDSKCWSAQVSEIAVLNKLLSPAGPVPLLCSRERTPASSYPPSEMLTMMSGDDGREWEQFHTLLCSDCLNDAQLTHGSRKGSV